MQSTLFVAPRRGVGFAANKVNLSRNWPNWIVSDYSSRWFCLLIITGFVGVWLAALNVSVEFGPIVPKFKFAGLLLMFSAVFTAIGNRWQNVHLPFAVVSDLSLTTVQVVVAMAVLAALSYLAATIGAPLVDERLAQLDAMLGFNWDAAAQWVGQRPILDGVLRSAYDSIALQPAVLLLIGSLKRPNDRNSEAIWLFIITLLLTCVIFAFTPALGKIGHVGTGYLSELADLRSGSWSVLSYSRVEGIVTFPSFHTTLALIFIYLARHDRWVLAMFVPLNIVMILSIPTVGGHYLIDLLGGAAVAAIGIPVVRKLRQHIAARTSASHQPLAGLQTDMRTRCTISRVMH